MPPNTARKDPPMHDEFSVSVARDIGGLQADVRTIKHDVANMSGKIDGLAAQIGTINTQQAKGFGFFGGIAFVIVSIGGLVIAAIKLFTPG